jgi:ABC-2 type transport system permease protein
MIGLIRAEVLKQRSTRTLLAVFAGMVVLVALVVGMHLLAPAAESLRDRDAQMKVFEVGTTIGALFAALLGALVVTAEFRYGTIRPTFVITPRRWPVIASKLLVAALLGVGFGLLAEGLMIGSAAWAFSARDVVSQITGSDYQRLLLGGAAAGALWAIIGVGVGNLVRNQAGSLVALFAWVFVVENLLRGFVPGFARFMPGSSALSLAGQTGGRLLAPLVGGLALVAYAVVVGAAGWVAMMRRDVS